MFMPNKNRTEESQSLPSIFGQGQSKSPQKNNEYLFSGQVFQPTLKVLATQKVQKFYYKGETIQNYSYRESYGQDYSQSPPKFFIEKQIDEIQRVLKRKKSIKAHYSPSPQLTQLPALINNQEISKKKLETLIDEIKDIKQRKSILDDQQISQLLRKHSPIHNYYYVKNLKQLYPFQIEKSVKELMQPILPQQQPQLITPVLAEKSLIYPLREKYQKPREQLEKLKNKLLKRRQTIFLQDTQVKEEPIIRKLKHFQRSTFESQCIHMVYIRPSAVRIQKYLIKDDNISDIIKKHMSYRWWWTEQESEDDEDVQFLWTTRPQASFLEKQRTKHVIDTIECQDFEKVLRNSEGVEDQMKYAIEQKLVLLSPFIKVHNHIDQFEQLFSKKKLITSMSKYCQLTGQNFENFIPKSIIVDYIGDEAFYNFIIANKTSTDIWVVQQADRNISKDIKICENTKSVFTAIHKEYQQPNRKRQVFTVQKYIRPFLYKQMKLDLCFFMLATQINGIVRVYLFEQFFGETSLINFSPFEQNQCVQTIEEEKQEKFQQIPMYKIVEYFDQHRVDFDYDLMPTIKEMLCEYIKSIYVDMIIRDHNFEVLYLIYIQLFKVIILIDNDHKPWLIDVKSSPKLQVNNDIMEELIPQLIDNTIQLSLDILFPSPTIWPKEKKKQIEIYPEKNDYVVIFDSRLDAQGLKSLYEEKQIENQHDDI